MLIMDYRSNEESFCKNNAGMRRFPTPGRDHLAIVDYGSVSSRGKRIAAESLSLDIINIIGREEDLDERVRLPQTFLDDDVLRMLSVRAPKCYVIRILTR